jgi:hypothetical protein
LKASTVFVAAISVATVIPVSMALLGIGAPSQASLGIYTGQDSKIEDARGDAQAVLQRTSSSIIPEVKPYHDIISASVRKADRSFVLTVNVAGNPNLNEKYETNYVWNLISSDALTGIDNHYLVMLVNFAPDFNHTYQGWHYAVFDRTAGLYIVPQTKIGDMPADRVEYAIDEALVGNPSSFRYWVSVYSRVNSTSFAGEPEYLMDYVP